MTQKELELGLRGFADAIAVQIGWKNERGGKALGYDFQIRGNATECKHKQAEKNSHSQLGLFL